MTVVVVVVVGGCHGECRGECNGNGGDEGGDGWFGRKGKEERRRFVFTFLSRGRWRGYARAGGNADGRQH